MPERRIGSRTFVSVPVEFEGGTGVTRDLSPSGVFFTTRGTVQLGKTFAFTLVFEDEGQPPTRIHCLGNVVRVEAATAGVGVAAAIQDFGSSGDTQSTR